MAKYYLEFPRKNASVEVDVNPIQIREVASQYIYKQSFAFGDICIVRESGAGGEIIAVVVERPGKPAFFIEEKEFELYALDLDRDE